MIKNINDDIKIAVNNYEQHFNQKAPPMGAVMSLPGIFAEYIKILNEAIKTDTPIQWNESIDWNNPEFNY